MVTMIPRIIGATGLLHTDAGISDLIDASGLFSGREFIQLYSSFPGFPDKYHEDEGDYLNSHSEEEC